MWWFRCATRWDYPNSLPLRTRWPVCHGHNGETVGTKARQVALPAMLGAFDEVRIVRDSESVQNLRLVVCLRA
jgi:hypothetical protein